HGVGLLLAGHGFGLHRRRLVVGKDAGGDAHHPDAVTGQSNYAASKAGVASLVVTWGKELARHGIRVMGIAPGVFATDMTAAMKPEAMARMQQAIPVGTLGQAAQLAQTVQFILANDYLSGRMIELDGGLRL
ncbi:SDR family oxidoreductase, partial [Aeromonas caviae]|uniref:SDR family oxidoreductase n=1 Tax=Aeromonas caviae TaxID=648 RepID=UPI0030142F32